MALAASLWAPGLGNALAGQEPEPEPPSHARIVTPEEVRRAAHPPLLLPLRVLSYPHRQISSGMEKGLITFEKHRMRERLRLWTEYLRNRGIEATFGGTGEQTGFGGGGSYTMRLAERQALRLLGRITSSDYQELDLQWATPIQNSDLVLEASYQWRPQENFYGLGHRSLRNQHTNFALRQSWTGLRWEIKPRNWLHFGTVYKLAWMSALPGANPAYPSPEVYFPGLPGFNTQTRLQSAGTYFDLEYLPSEYALGGMMHLGASYQNGWGASKLSYFNYEIQLEGRAPVASGRGALVGQANLAFNRERGGSDPIPFYLQPHIGGSSTLRGFALDRYYGRSLALLSLEYRYRVHPNIQAIPFFDEGQIFNRTSDLGWINWHRNYGLGFRYRTARGTFLRLEYGRGKEGSRIHIVFGDRERPPLTGPIRYGAYKR